MKKSRGSFNLGPVVLVTAVGAGGIFLTANLLAKPNVPRVAAAAAPRGDAPETSPTSRPQARVQPSPGAVEVKTVGLDPGLAQPGVNLAAAEGLPGTAKSETQPIRDLFQPLVVKPKSAIMKGGVAAGGPKGQTPVLPTAGGANSMIARRTPGGPGQGSSNSTSTVPVSHELSVRDLRMMGVVELDGKPQVLLKNPETGESRYFAKGDEAFGFRVEEIKAEQVSLSRLGKTETVAMSNDVVLESTAGTSTAGASGFGGRGGFGRGGFGGGGNDGQGGFNRRNRGGGDSAGGRSRGGDSSGAMADVMSLPTWTERLKKLEEIRSQLEPERYNRLRQLMTDRAKAEKK